MRKRFLFLFLVLFITVALPLVANANIKMVGSCGDNVGFILTDDGAVTISGDGPMEDFSGSSPWGIYIKQAYIESGVTRIGRSAFKHCDQLVRLEISDSVISIGDYAFWACTQLTSAAIPSSVTSIGNDAFAFCKNLTSIAIPESVTFIGAEAFRECNGLKTVSIPTSVTGFGTDIFLNCSKDLTIQCYAGSKAEEYAKANSIKVKLMFETQTGTCGDNVVWTLDNTGLLTISGTGAMKNYTYRTKDTSELLGASIKQVEIQSGVTSIGIFAFSGCSNLESVKIPDSVTSIEEGAFLDCTGLTSIMIPDSVTNIGDYAFYSCSNDLTIQCSLGSEAYRYATENKIKVELIEKA